MPYSDEEILGRKWFGTLYFDSLGVEKVKRITRKGIADEGISFLKDYVDKCYAQAHSFLEVSKKISEIPKLNILSNEEIVNLFESYREEAFRMSSFLLTIIAIQFVLEEEIKTGLIEILTSQGNSNLFEDIRRKLSNPIKETPEIENMMDLLKLSAEVQKSPNLFSLFNKKTEVIEKELQRIDFGKKIKNYVEKFAWMQPMYYRGKPMEVRDAILQIQTSLRRDCVKLLEEIEKRRKKSKADYEEILEKLNPSRNFISLIEILQDFLYLRTYRLEVFFMTNHLVLNLLEEIAQRLGISYDDVLFMRCEEITSLIKTRKTAPKEIIKERKKGYAVVKLDSEVKWYSGKDLLEFLASEPSEKFPENEVKGMVAWPGRVVGTVKLILSNEDMGKMEEGDILVTTMTTPSLMPAIQKAKGIITNEGGILCHAAIVSREFGIPCLIGTNYATYVFKDNDLVEIYGEPGLSQGLARKLEK